MLFREMIPVPLRFLVWFVLSWHNINTTYLQKLTTIRSSMTLLESPVSLSGTTVWYKRTGTSKDADFSSFTLSVIQFHWCSLIQNKAGYCRVISSKHCEVPASCNKAKPSSILLKPESLLYSDPLKIHWLTRNLPESWPQLCSNWE